MKLPRYDPVGVNPSDVVLFPLGVPGYLCRGMEIGQWDARMVWQKVFLVIHIDHKARMAATLRVPWYFCLRITAANVWRWLCWQFRRLRRRD